MKILKTVLVALIVTAASTVQAQKIKVTKGVLAFLKGQTELLLEYDYSNMAVGKFDNEEDYIAKKTAEYNDTEAGKGDQWAENWVNDRNARLHPKIEEIANRYTEKLNCKVGKSNT